MDQLGRAADSWWRKGLDTDPRFIQLGYCSRAAGVYKMVYSPLANFPRSHARQHSACKLARRLSCDMLAGGIMVLRH